jgi:phage terminase small subunit
MRWKKCSTTTSRVRPRSDLVALNARQVRFVQEYLLDLNATQAAIRAGYSAKTAKVIGSENLTKPDIAAAIGSAQQKRAERVQISADSVLRELQTIAAADPRELVEFRRVCCRHCWGKGFRYQRTAGEMERDMESHSARCVELEEAGKPTLPPFDDKGGIGFTPKRDPNQKCPECFGDGVGETFVHDTRKLGPGAARLLAGIKQTREGMEIKMLSQDDALVNLGRHLGIFTDKLQIDATVKGSVSYKANMPARS